MKKTISLFGGLLVVLFLVSAVGAQPHDTWDSERGDIYRFDPGRSGHLVFDLVLVVSAGGEGMAMRPEARELMRDLIMDIRMRHRFIRYVAGPWEDSRAHTPDIVVFWGAARDRCHIERWMGRRFIAFYARGDNERVARRVLRRLVPCVRRFLRRVDD